MYKAEILADSINPQKDRITTMKITFPRMMLAELNTHRVFSRNSASSRAIPFKKMVKMVKENPFIPIAWQRDHKGMQGTEYIDHPDEIEPRINDWLDARNDVINRAKYLNEMGVTKQLCNRILEPFMWHTVIVTATEWENFFKLRCPQYEGYQGRLFRSKKEFDNNNPIVEFGLPHNDIWWLQRNKSQADIHIQAIAELMWDAYNESVPKELRAGEWHIPFGDNMNETELFKVANKITKKERPDLYPHSTLSKELTKVRVATARCARISYETLGDNPKIDYEADIRLHDMLAESGHWSPFEHCAKAMNDVELNISSRFEDKHKTYGWCRNFKGFIQYRSLVDKF